MHTALPFSCPLSRSHEHTNTQTPKHTNTRTHTGVRALRLHSVCRRPRGAPLCARHIRGDGLECHHIWSDVYQSVYLVARLSSVHLSLISSVTYFSFSRSLWPPVAVRRCVLHACPFARLRAVRCVRHAHPRCPTGAEDLASAAFSVIDWNCTTAA